ncbi:DUF469 family protein [Cronobacter sakazakii]|nr:DUF469 family protein [Cronobacter sakazakii]MBF4909218.1 DUF469 family protein [Cronobacter sakazakii]
MAKNRSRRLRKKMHIDEFQELGFTVTWRFPQGATDEQINTRHRIMYRARPRAR